MPRKAADALVFPTISQRLHPPPGLSEGAKAEFIRIVTCEKPEHFTKSDLSMLCQFCEAAALAELAIKEALRENPPNGRWMMSWREGTRTMKDLALRLRLSPQSRMPNNPTRRPPERVSYYEREALEHDEAE